MKKILSTAVLVLTGFAGSAMADTMGDKYVCKHGDKTRTITVMYKSADSKVPCEVLYEKDTGTQTLWNAQAETGYCEGKAKDFVAKQEGWGWSCS